MSVSHRSNLPEQQPRLVLFDFDGTLISGDNGTRMIVEFARSRGWPLITSILCTPIILPLLLFPPTKRLGASMYLWLSTVGMGKNQINRCLKRLAAVTAGNPQHYRIEPAWERLQQHLQAGDKVVVITGCWEKMAKKTLKAMGLNGVTVIGSRKQRWLGGYISNPHCYGKNKVHCLASQNITPPWTYAYTDSVSDRHLLRLADKPVLVRPSLYSLIRVKSIFGNIEVIK